jgi:hypothetical protein
VSSYLVPVFFVVKEGAAESFGVKDGGVAHSCSNTSLDFFFFFGRVNSSALFPSPFLFPLLPMLERYHTPLHAMAYIPQHIVHKDKKRKSNHTLTGNTPQATA